MSIEELFAKAWSLIVVMVGACGSYLLYKKKKDDDHEEEQDRRIDKLEDNQIQYNVKVDHILESILDMKEMMKGKSRR